VSKARATTASKRSNSAWHLRRGRAYLSSRRTNRAPRQAIPRRSHRHAAGLGERRSGRAAFASGDGENRTST
jgi:hypothetical protein